MSRKALWLAALAALILAVAGVVWARRPAAPPQQPIAFDHKIHRDFGMDCAACHQLVDKAERSGLPTANLCMTCHTVFKADSPEVKKIAQFRDSRRPIPWVRLYQLPDFVYFNHARHVKSGIACAQCHGSTGTVRASRTEREIDMDFCTECHTERGAPNDCATCHQ